MRVPRATYRLQLSGETTFGDAAALVPYLAELGVSDLYASPYLKARAGSEHGYDVVDHGALNPELGGEGEYTRLVEALAEHGMGQLLDIVPNHVGVGGDNAMWLDLLENGEASAYASYFDVDWRPEDRPGLRDRLLLPVLGGHYRAVLEGGELRLDFDAGEGTLHVEYYEHRLPIDPRTYPLVLGSSVAGEEGPQTALGRLAAGFGALPEREAGGGSASRRAREAAALKAELAAACADSAEVAEAVRERVRRLNEETEELHRLLEAQAYRLAYWRVAGEEINYRRFFAINDLAGVRVEREEVFRAVHGLVLELLEAGAVDGLRIDHPDGLYDPAGYFGRLQEAATAATGEPAYVLVEKILGPDERLPDEWPVAGTTGYEFTNALNGLFVERANRDAMDAAYREFLGESPDFERILLRCKRRMMETQLWSELDALARRLRRICLRGRRYDYALNTLREAVLEVVARFPVYRTYIVPGEVSDADRRHVEGAVSAAKRAGTGLEPEVFDLIAGVLLSTSGPEDLREMELGFTMKFQQYTGPVMAKGMEDTALYIYNRLASLNEVGGEPEVFGIGVEEFHRLNAERLRSWPHSMLATSTHDTKRSEDVRARIDVLSEIPVEWSRRARRWSELNAPLRREVGGAPAPTPNDEYLLYQTLIGAWPLGDAAPDEEFRGRIKAYMEKAMREAQENTAWDAPDEEYEGAVSEFVDALLAPEAGGRAFLEDFLTLGRRVARVGAVNSLSQTLLKLTVPGVPDIYQGNELWDLSLVDPDNRRPVDYGLRRRLLEGLAGMDPAAAPALLEDGAWQDGRAKLHIVHRALRARRERPETFRDGRYEALAVRGTRGDRLVALARDGGPDGAAIVVAPRLVAGMLAFEGPLLPDPEAWADTAVVLPDALAGGAYRNVLTGERVLVDGGEAALRAGDLLRRFPVALLVSER